MPLPLAAPVCRSRQRLTFTSGEMLLDDLAFLPPEGEPIPAWFLHPPSPKAPVAAMLYCHAHGDRPEIGRAELLLGRPALTAPYAPDLAALGLAVLCLEMPCFGARSLPVEQARSKAHLWRGSTLFGQMLGEQAAGVDFLAGQQQVDATRIGAMGISMGGTLAWWLAALDPRIRAVAHMCCLADMGRLIETGAHDIHGIYMTVPGLLSLARTGQVAGLTKPRAQLACIGLTDPSTPEAAWAVARADLVQAYADAPGGRLTLLVDPAAGHAETPQMRAKVIAFLRRHLLLPTDAETPPP